MFESFRGRHFFFDFNDLQMQKFSLMQNRKSCAQCFALWRMEGNVMRGILELFFVVSLVAGGTKYGDRLLMMMKRAAFEKVIEHGKRDTLTNLTKGLTGRPPARSR